MKYKVVISEQAASDLRAIFDYIAYELMAGQTALKQLERIEEAVLSLGEMPERNRLYKKEPWRSKNLRVMSVDNYLVLYYPKEEEKTVMVVQVVYGRRDIDARLEDVWNRESPSENKAEKQ